MQTLEQLIARARAYRADKFPEQQPHYQRLVSEGQSPKILMIACSDSRVDPTIIFGAEPGEIFLVRNVASLVPPFQPDTACHGTSAALEFGVTNLGVEHVIVLGHGYCGGVAALLAGADKDRTSSDFIGPWLSSVAAVRDRLLSEHPDLPQEEAERQLEFATVRQSVENLRSFPWIAERVEKGTLALHGWHVDIAKGALRDVGDPASPRLISG